MAKLQIKAGTTSKRLAIYVTDASSTVGAGLAGLAFDTFGLTAYYWREDAGNVDATAITLVTATRGTWTSSGFIAKDGTNMPGAYEIGLPDAVLAAGAKWVVVVLKGASNMVPVALEIQLTSYDPGESLEQTGDTYALANGASGFVATKADTAAILVDTADMQPKLGAPAGASMSADIAAVKVDTAATLVDTAEIGVAGAGLTALAQATVATEARLAELDPANLPTDIAAVKTDTAATLVDTGTTLDGRIPAALVAGRMDASVGAVAAGAITAAAIATGAVDADALAADGCNKVADHVWRRTAANVRASSDGDAVVFRSPLGMLSKHVNKIAVSGSNLEIYDETDGGTPFFTQTITSDSGADPISGLDTV